jgi:hypothetical protein
MRLVTSCFVTFGTLTRKGPLLLFSKEVHESQENLSDDESIGLYDWMPMRTVNDLQMNVLFYGINDRTVRLSKLVLQ